MSLNFVVFQVILLVILWYNFTLISAVYTKHYLNLSNGDSFTFTLVTFGYGAFLKLITLKNYKQISDQVSNYFYLAVCNVASLLLTNIAIHRTTVSFIYIVKVSIPC